jgi:hypothetical protein
MAENNIQEVDDNNCKLERNFNSSDNLILSPRQYSPDNQPRFFQKNPNKALKSGNCTKDGWKLTHQEVLPWKIKEADELRRRRMEAGEFYRGQMEADEFCRSRTDDDEYFTLKSHFRRQKEEETSGNRRIMEDKDHVVRWSEVAESLDYVLFRIFFFGVVSLTVICCTVLVQHYLASDDNSAHHDTSIF